MESIKLSFEAVMSIFILMMVGYFIKKIKLADKKSFNVINKLIFKVFLPVLLFYNIYNTNLAGLFDVKSADELIETIYNSIKNFEKEAISAGKEYSTYRMNQCIAVSIYGVSLTSELKTLILFAMFTYMALMLFCISKKFPRKA